MVFPQPFFSPSFSTVDPYTVLLLHFSGSDGSTTFTDSSTQGAGSPHSFTVVGSSQIDTAQFYFSPSSGLFDATEDYIYAASHADLQFGSGDFTIDFRVRFNALTGGTFPGFFGKRGISDNREIEVYYDVNSDLLTVRYTTDGTNWISRTFSWNPSTATWYHVAIVRNGTDLMVFIDGTQIGSTETIGTLPAGTGPFVIGNTAQTNATNASLNGWFDEFRVSKGIARWTGNFTPPASAYTE